MTLLVYKKGAAGVERRRKGNKDNKGVAPGEQIWPISNHAKPGAMVMESPIIELLVEDEITIREHLVSSRLFSIYKAHEAPQGGGR